MNYVACNFGTASTDKFQDSFQDAWGRLKAVDQGPIAPGQCFGGWQAYPTGLSTGNYGFYVFLDSANKVEEVNENNNMSYYGAIVQ